jgi:hypothetical protein
MLPEILWVETHAPCGGWLGYERPGWISRRESNLRLVVNAFNILAHRGLEVDEVVDVVWLVDDKPEVVRLFNASRSSNVCLARCSSQTQKYPIKPLAVQFACSRLLPG